MTPDVLVAIIGMAAASYACRAGGFWLMGFVPITRRVRAGLEAIPIAVMAAILAPVAARGGPAEAAGLVAALAVMRATGNDLAGALAGVAAVALVRTLAA
ncbi:MAG: AzlD domain-containing protein [Alphaproteobacteria bacterium]|nr:AzlD domain-containing protein [Alphaproteobacteria bacterium]